MQGRLACGDVGGGTGVRACEGVQEQGVRVCVCYAQGRRCVADSLSVSVQVWVCKRVREGESTSEAVGVCMYGKVCYCARVSRCVYKVRSGCVDACSPLVRLDVYLGKSGRHQERRAHGLASSSACFW